MNTMLEHPVFEVPELLLQKAMPFRQIELDEIERIRQASLAAAEAWPATAAAPLAASLDYSALIPFIREQGGYSCGMQAVAACWDILNEMVTTYSPNVSVNRMIWLWKWIDIDKKTVTGHDGKSYASVQNYEEVLGIPTEGAELTNTDAVQWPTEEGNIESPNFRLAGAPVAVPVQVAALKSALMKGPLRVGIWHDHFVALVGYDDVAMRFKFVNSWGDQWGTGGFGYVKYADLTKDIQGAEQFQVVAPKSLAVSRISLTAACRQDVFLWLGVEGVPSAKRIWPTGQLQDVSRNLTLTVTVPRGFEWPPKVGNRLYLDIYDCGKHYESPGTLSSFVAAFCGQVIPSAQVAQAPVTIKPHALTRIYLP